MEGLSEEVRTDVTQQICVVQLEAEPVAPPTRGYSRLTTPGPLGM